MVSILQHHLDKLIIVQLSIAILQYQTLTIVDMEASRYIYRKKYGTRTGVAELMCDQLDGTCSKEKDLFKDGYLPRNGNLLRYGDCCMFGNSPRVSDRLRDGDHPRDGDSPLHCGSPWHLQG